MARLKILGIGIIRLVSSWKSCFKSCRCGWWRKIILSLIFCKKNLLEGDNLRVEKLQCLRICSWPVAWVCWWGVRWYSWTRGRGRWRGAWTCCAEVKNLSSTRAWVGHLAELEVRRCKLVLEFEFGTGLGVMMRALREVSEFGCSYSCLICFVF